MNSRSPTSSIEQILLSGPRGRRLLLEYALASELANNPVRTEDTFGHAVVVASRHLEPGNNTTAVFGWHNSDIPPLEVKPAQVAERLNTLELFEPTPQLLRQALVAAVGNARYWQEPDGEDLLAAAPDMYLGLQRVAQHIATSQLTAWWCTPAYIPAQYAVQWEDARLPAIPDDIQAALLAARHRERTEEHTARTERDADPTANWTGEWWSHPPKTMPSSTRLLCDGSPAGLWFVEDHLGWEGADSVELIAPKDASVFEIHGADDWAELCARFPLEVTAQKRHDWYRTTGRTGRWVLPDWVQVADHYDAVHLQVGAYLAVAGVAIPVNHRTGSASVIAGWNPDETYWFSSNITYGNEGICWALKDDGTEMVWKPAPTRRPHQHR
ncbi:MAG: hypothetical protein L0I94_10640 [Yaniella sp.]|uniref:hypothetical protein n=1 Tax=Yaniella sp. TaxID=2773929 RepID=UPI002648CFA6|nr:hypothetical protein [Yaniella sp.]MDN5731622.1 hypothetical protein [Yaniella sp.]MDN5816221.1 hypothetical protein [Yaniella sp.]MDN5818727.1 hypothetical protein [Yaniella sp.]MDN5839042.1 hypothetical protein [Yaniella sp.]MDN5890185.1 hypothetical protein [Yaniella sp.]